eukprot:919372-Rhodomonas_salina.5
MGGALVCGQERGWSPLMTMIMARMVSATQVYSSTHRAKLATSNTTACTVNANTKRRRPTRQQR